MYSAAPTDKNLRLLEWKEKVEKGLERKKREREEAEWTEKVEIRKENIFGSGRSRHGYILNHSRL